MRDVVSLGGKYVFSTVISLVLPMCILISCSSLLCVLMALGMFVKVMSSLISVMSHILVCALCLCVWWCSVVFLVFSFLCEFCFLYCDDVRLGAVDDFFLVSRFCF